jgi:hypothetical protein
MFAAYDSHILFYLFFVCTLVLYLKGTIIKNKAF